MLVSNSVLKNITDLALMMAQSNAQLVQLEKTSPENPQISSLKVKIESLEQEIKDEREQLAGPNGSLAPSIAEYDRLLLDQQFSVRMFSSAVTSLEAARVEALRQRAFLEEITEPNQPDRPTYPYRLISILSVLGVSWMIYRVGCVFLADTLEHASR
jgi:capsular polysaccharide transport system permease protein